MRATSATEIQQILYKSYSTVPGDGADLVGILQQSRHNNALDEVTGIYGLTGHTFCR
jgi:hypothetical protein